MNLNLLKKILNIFYFIYNFLCNFFDKKDIIKYLFLILSTTFFTMIVNFFVLSHAIKKYTLNQVDNSHKRLLIRQKAENVRNKACIENGFDVNKCPLLIRSFFVDNNKAWCMGHADMLKTNTYFTVDRRCLISEGCFEYLANTKYAIITKKILEKYCPFLSEDCIFKSFDGNKYHKLALSCVFHKKNDNYIKNILHGHFFGDKQRLTCFALVDNNKIEEFTEHLHGGIAKTIMNQILDYNLNYFDE